MANIINKEKLIRALLAYPEMEEEIISLYTRAGIIDDMIAQRKVSESYRMNAQVYACVCQNDVKRLQTKRIALAKQTLGVLSKLQRETGFRIITRYIKDDAEKLSLLTELCNLFDEQSAFLNEYCTA